MGGIGGLRVRFVSNSSCVWSGALDRGLMRCGWVRAGLEYRVRGADEAYPEVAHASLLGGPGTALRAQRAAYSEDAGVEDWKFVEGGEVWCGDFGRECQWR